MPRLSNLCLAVSRHKFSVHAPHFRTRIVWHCALCYRGGPSGAVSGLPFFLDDDARGTPIPVIARTLATAESPYSRYIKKGANKGLLVPVVVQPVEGEPFRSVILLRETGGVQVEEPEVGTLMALRQVERGMGELANIDQVTPEQEALRERLARHPRQLSNRAPALPMRRGSLERVPASAAAEWWGALGAGLAVVLAYIWVIY